MNDATEKKIYPSMKALSNAQGIPLVQLKIAKRLNAPGFNTNNTINWELLSPWYEANKTSLTVSIDDTYEHWHAVNEKLTAHIKEEQLKNLRKESLDPKEVFALLNRIKTASNSLFTAKLTKELPEQIKQLCPDIDMKQLTTLTDNQANEICRVFDKEFEQWMQR